MSRIPSLALFLALAIVLALAGCSGKEESPAPPATASTAATLSPTPPSTSTPAPTPLPTVPATTLGLRAVEVSTGRNVTLPVEFGRASAWSRDSSLVAVAGAGLAVGRTDGTPFRLFWPSDCYDVEWSPTADLVGVICKDVVGIFDAAGNAVMRVPVSSASFLAKQPSVGWSFDGQLLAYGPVSGSLPILRLGASHQPLDVTGSFTGFQWLADGRLATFEQPDYRDPCIIRIFDPGGTVAAVTYTTPDAAAGVALNPAGNLASFSVPGSGLTFAIVSITDGNQLVSLPGAVSNYNGASFSRDGGRALMGSGFCTPDWLLESVGTDGSRLPLSKGSFMAAKFSPDGSQVAFTRGITLWVVAADGSSAPRQLADEVHGPAGFEWSPDSRWISVPPFFGGFDQCL